MQEKIMYLTPHFTLNEMTFSMTGTRLEIDNTIPESILPAVIKTCEGLEKIRQACGFSIRVLSGYRCPELNRAIHGAVHSQHMKGEAADIICPDMANMIKFARLIEDNLVAWGVDQLIYEFGSWIHVSFTDNPRNKVLTIRNAQEGYIEGLHF
jgi:zinc D-Ala-D-Ala carboxypeptidase